MMSAVAWNLQDKPQLSARSPMMPMSSPALLSLAAPDGPAAALLLAESQALIAGPPKLLEGLDAKERDYVMSRGRRRVLDRGAPVFTQGEAHEGIYLVESGRIRVFYTAPSGREITLAYWFPGNFVGGPEVFGGTHMWSAVAARNSAVLMLPGEDLRAMVARFPGLAMGIIEGLVFKGKCYSALAQMLGTRSVTERLAQLLLHLVSLYGSQEEEGAVIGAAFTHEDLAHMVGATRQWITISLKRMEKAGLLITRKGRIVVCDPDRLAQIHEAP
jgi:CRP-like cAMP-binding protein